MPNRPERVLSRRYSLLATASVVPLAVIIVALALFQFGAQRQQLLEELEEQAVEHNTLLVSILKTVHDYVDTLAAWGEIYGQAGAGRAVASLAAGRSLDHGALVIAGAGLATRPDAAVDRVLAGELARHMGIAHRAMPYLRWSHYIAGAADLAALAPFSAGQSLGGALRQASDDQALARLAGALGPGPTELSGSSRHWSAGRLDPAGAGWVTTLTEPVTLEGEVIGVVGTTMLLDFLTSFLRAFDYPCGRLWLVDAEGQVLAASEGGIFGATRLSTLEDVLPEGLAALASELVLTPSRAFRALEGHHVLAQRVGSTPWTLLFVAEASAVDAVILPRFVPYGIILLGLILTLLLSHVLRQRLIVRPALAFADFIRAETREEAPGPPALPGFWNPLAGAVAEAFAAKRNTLALIQDSEALKAAIIDSAFDALIAIDTEDRIVEFNPAAEAMFGVPRATAIGQDLAQLVVPPALRAAHEAGMRRYLATGEAKVLGRRVEYEAVRATGASFPIEVAIAEVRQADRRLFIAYVRDIADRRAMEAALRASEHHFRMIADAHPVALNITRLEGGIILHASQAFADLFGLPRDAIVGHDTMRFYADPGDRARLLAALRQDGRVEGFEVVARRADGSLFPAALTSRLIEFQGAPSVISAVIDLSGQKAAEAEIARQREALHQSEKLNALGSLLANVAHELNNPLSVVVGYATMMRDLAADAVARERATKVQAAAERCARIVKTFLAMARQKPESFGSVAINQTIQGALEVAGYGLRTTDVEVDLELAPGLPMVVGDGDQLTLVLMNLIVNAQHALQTRPVPRRLEIVTRAAGDGVVVELADNGPGVPAEIAERIFEPFFTTKPQGVGTGIGLSVCHGIVSAHGGEIAVASRLGGGALFIISLPVAAASATAATTVDEGPGQLTGRILVVEDEVEIGEMLAEVLGRDRHEIVLARSGLEALERLDAGPVDLILSDLRMPGLDGPGLHRALLDRSPALAMRMVFMTGDVLTPETGNFIAECHLPVLEKPLDPYDLRLKVRGFLAEARTPEGLRRRSAVPETVRR